MLNIHVRTLIDEPYIDTVTFKVLDVVSVTTRDLRDPDVKSSWETAIQCILGRQLPKSQYSILYDAPKGFDYTILVPLQKTPDVISVEALAQPYERHLMKLRLNNGEIKEINIPVSSWRDAARKIIKHVLNIDNPADSSYTIIWGDGVNPCNFKIQMGLR